MKLAVVFLNKIEYLEELLSLFLEIGLTGATVVDSVGMGHIISESIPIFAGLRKAFAGSSPNKKVIFAVTNEKVIQDMAKVIDGLGQDEEDQKPGFMISLSVESIFGLNIPAD